jgi:glutamate synthase (NADPH/NADH) small chain
MEKRLIDRRVEQMRQEGVTFRTGVHVGRDLPAARLLDEFDAVVLTGGAEQPRDLPVPGRELAGVHFAMQFLEQQNRRNAGDTIPAAEAISAKDKHVIVIGGGDTGSDCIGTSIRQGAHSVTQIEILPKPPESPDKGTIWPYWPNRLRTSSSQAEGVARDWCVATKVLRGTGGRVQSLHAVRVEWQQDAQGRWQMRELPDQTLELKADLVLLAMGFVHPVHAGLLEELGVMRDARGNVAADTEKYQTSIPQVFAAGDMRRGQSLVVWAIREGRQAAHSVDKFLMGSSELPR